MSDINIVITSADDMTVVVQDSQNTGITAVRVNEIPPPSLNTLVGVNINQPENDDGLFFDSISGLWQNKTINETSSPVDGGTFF